MLAVVTNDSLLVNFSSRLTTLDQQTNQLVTVALSAASLSTDLQANISQLSAALTQDSQIYTSQYFTGQTSHVVSLVTTLRSQFLVIEADIVQTKALLISAHTLVTQTLFSQVLQLNTTVQEIVNLRVLQNSTVSAMQQQAERLQSEAQRIAVQTNQAVRLANQSLNIIQQALETQVNTANRLDNISMVLSTSRDVLTPAVQTLPSIMAIQEAANIALQNSTSPFFLPSISDDLATAQHLANDSRSLQLQAIGLRDYYAEIAGNITAYQTTVAHLMTNITDAKRDAESLARRATDSNSSAQMAASTSAAALSSLQSMLATLRNFSQATTAARQQAVQSLMSVSTANATAHHLQVEAAAILSQHQSASQQANLAANASRSATQSSQSAVQVNRILCVSKLTHSIQE